MNAPLGDREVLCVPQFTLYADARKRQPALLHRRGAAGARRAALRALLRAPGRPARRLRRPHGGRARQRRAGDGAARAVSGRSTTLRTRAARGPLRLPLRRRAAPGGGALRPLGRSACRRSSWPPSRPSTPTTRTWASPASRPGTPTARGAGAPTSPSPRRPSDGPRALRLRLLRARGRRRRAGRVLRVGRLHRRDRRPQPGLAARPLRGGRRRLARRGAATWPR